MTAPPPVGPWLLARECSKRARCGLREIIAALNDGSLVGYQRTKGGTWRIHIDDLDAWIRGEAPTSESAKLGWRSA